MSIPVLMHLKKAVQKNKAYAAQKDAELAETTVAALTELQENKQSLPLHGAVTIPTSGWNNDNTEKYPYYYDISINDITAQDRPAITPKIESLDAVKICGFCSICESQENKIRVWAANVPTSDIQIEYWIEKGKE